MGVHQGSAGRLVRMGGHAAHRPAGRCVEGRSRGKAELLSPKALAVWVGTLKTECVSFTPCKEFSA